MIEDVLSVKSREKFNRVVICTFCNVGIRLVIAYSTLIS